LFVARRLLLAFGASSAREAEFAQLAGRLPVRLVADTDGVAREACAS
jgi:hypothetical protein